MVLIQFTGLSGSGKTTLALNVQKLLHQKGYVVEVIDGDVYRQKFCSDLGFSKEDRYESIKRLFSIAEGFVKSNKIVLMAVINPYEYLRNELGKNDFVKLVYLDCKLENLIKRDTKGLYFKALLPDENPNKILNFTGISDVFEIPKIADLVLKTDSETVAVSQSKLYNFIIQIIENNSSN